MQVQDYKIKNMTRAELDIAVDWAAKEGWNPGLYDAEVFYNTDPQGFFMGFLNNKPISCISVVKYGSKFGFLGFYIVKPEYRGQSYGLKLWNEALKQSPVQSMGLDGVFAQQENYQKSGFEFSHRNLRMEGTGQRESYSQNVTPVTKSDFDQINKLDQECFGFDRTTFLRGWLNLPDSLALKYQTKGYGVIRKCRQGYKIGPLFADNFFVAHELFKGLAVFAAGEKIYLDTPEINTDALKLAAQYNMKECFGCARMYYGPAPALPYTKIFGVTTFELG